MNGAGRILHGEPPRISTLGYFINPSSNPAPSLMTRPTNFHHADQPDGSSNDTYEYPYGPSLLCVYLSMLI